MAMKRRKSPSQVVGRIARGRGLLLDRQGVITWLDNRCNPTTRKPKAKDPIEFYVLVQMKDLIELIEAIEGRPVQSTDHQ